jgi:hypothetical protein
MYHGPFELSVSNNFTQDLTHYFEILAGTPILMADVDTVSRTGATQMLVYIQGVPGGKDITSGECSLC